MHFGVCAPIHQADQAKAYGWDFIELNAQSAFQGLRDDGEWVAPTSAPLPTPAANSLVPGTLKVVGPDVDVDRLGDYLWRVLSRAAQAGCTMLVFGSGAARQVPDGWDRGLARQQILDFLRAAGTGAAEHDITVVVEPLNRRECNILNTVGECVRIVRELNHPNVRQLIDSYHLWVDDDALEAVRDAGPLVRHVHVADRDGRVPPGESGTSDYRPVFGTLKAAGYDGRISVECVGWDWAAHGERCLAFLKRAWDGA